MYKEHENQKKRHYNDRVVHIEKGTFSPLVFSTYGGMAPECERHHKRIAEKLSIKKNETYADTIRYSILI